MAPTKSTELVDDCFADALSGRKILFVFCSLELGGAERQGLYLARHLQKVGCEVSVLASQAGRGLVAQRCEEMEIPWSVARFRWPCRKSSLARDGWRFLRALRRESPDVIVSYTTCPNVGCGLLWRLSPASVCVWGQRNVGDLRGDAVERFACRRSSVVICNAEHQVAYLRDTLGPTHAPVHVVHNGVELSPPERTREEWRHRLGMAADAVVATMVANFRAQKDHATLLQAWRIVMDSQANGDCRFHLLLAGVPLGTYPAVRALASHLKLDDSVTFLGQVTDISGLLSASDIGVLVSTREGLSNAVMEYMASGLPVIATDLPGNREALGDGYAHPLVADGGVGHVADSLGQLIGNASLRQRLGDCNRQRVEGEFSVDAMCRRMLCLIGSQLNG